MIHKYKYKGSNIVIDVNSGSIHSVDNLTYDVLDALEASGGDSIDISNQLSKYGKDEINECLNELSELKKQNKLFSNLSISHNVTPVVKALCLHISHDCNLKCKYCFAGEGEYHGERSLMSVETGKKAIDFIVKNSAGRKNLEIDFFGGEPTINFNTVKEIVYYAKKEKTKNFRFTLTTNGFAITDEIIDFCNEHMYNLVLSIDGRENVHDAMRPDRGGNGSYKKVIGNINKFLTARQFERYYVRGTFTRNNLDFSNDVTHLADLGYKQISIEPVVAKSCAPYSLRESDLPALFKEYDRLTDIMCKRDDFSFFHFNVDLTGGSCVYKRISGCGAGCEYMSVTPDGALFPCHQFTGIDGFKLGTIFDGVTNNAIQERFSKLNVLTKRECDSCWAKYYCSGGCAANSYAFGGDIYANYELGCALQKKRIECAIYLKLYNAGLLRFGT